MSPKLTSGAAFNWILDANASGAAMSSSESGPDPALHSERLSAQAHCYECSLNGARMCMQMDRIAAPHLY